MRASFSFLIVWLLLAWPARAQVSINLDALNPPAAKPAPAHRPAPKPPEKHVTRSQARQRAAVAAKPGRARTEAKSEAADAPGGPKREKAATHRNGKGAKTPAQATAAASTPMPALPDAPPKPPVLAPLAPVPLVAHPVAPTPPRTSATAGSSTARIPDGMRIIFATGQSELTPESANALNAFARQVPDSNTVSLDVRAYAAGAPDDPSTPRRLALERAMAIRGALMVDGISSTRIFVRAMGAPAPTDSDPADRVDVAVLGLASTGARLDAAAPASR